MNWESKQFSPNCPELPLLLPTGIRGQGLASVVVPALLGRGLPAGGQALDTRSSRLSLSGQEDHDRVWTKGAGRGNTDQLLAFLIP